MKSLTVKKILEVTEGELLSGNKDFICESFCRDTRIIKKGDTYIGINGENFKGSSFWKEAFDNGAECVIVSNIEISANEIEQYKDKTIIKVGDTSKALWKIAKAKRDLYKIPVIAVTGSVGKTSTKDIIASVVSQKYKTLKTIGNNNNQIGLPFTILRLKDEEAIVLEMGMNHFGEIRLLTDIAKPDICVITNIGTSHIGNLGSRENILKAKLEILEGSKNPAVVINNDNDLLHKWYEENKEKMEIHTYGINEKSDINASDILLKSDGSKFMANVYNNKHEVNVPVGGEHFVLNALCAITVGEILNIETNNILKGIGEFELTKNRMDISEKNGITVINDAYNASLESMKASLKYLAEFNNKRKIAILGDMFELGEYAKELHKKVGGEIHKNNIDILFCCGENSKYIVEQAEAEGMNKDNIYYMKTQEEIVQKVRKIAKQGDVILVKASNGMKFYELPEKILSCSRKK